MKFKTVRLFLRKVKALVLLRLHRYIDKEAKESQAYDHWHQFKTCSTNIVSRPELGEQNQNRLDNMKLCAEKLTGLCLKPGQILSLMEIIGEATESDGFKSGPMLIDGKLHKTTGGGICQVSTTLYNLALASGLKIIEKHNHTWDTWGEDRFIELGRDATYVYARKDIAFKNIYSTPLVLFMSLNEEKLTLNSSLYSKEPMNVEVETTSKVLKKLGQGEKATGWLVETESIRKDKSGKQKIYHRIDTYKPL